MVAAGVIELLGSRGDTVYELTPAAREAARCGTGPGRPVLDARASMVLHLLQNHGPLTTGQLARRTGCSKPVVRKALRELMATGRVTATTDALHARNRAYQVVDRR